MERDVLWLEATGDGGYVSDASRALDMPDEEPCRMHLMRSGYGLSVTRHGMTLAQLEVDDDFIVRSISVGYAIPHVTAEKMNGLQRFIGRKVLYKSGEGR